MSAPAAVLSLAQSTTLVPASVVTALGDAIQQANTVEQAIAAARANGQALPECEPVLQAVRAMRREFGLAQSAALAGLAAYRQAVTAAGTVQ